MLLEVQNLALAYGDVQVLWDVSLQVPEGEIVVLIGPNGAGKTTLMRAIAGLQTPLTGGVWFDGKPLHGKPPHQLVQLGVVLVPEGRRLFGSMTVLENLELGAFTTRARAKRDRTLREVFEIFPLLAERRHQRAQTLSGGQQQMLAIGRALMGLPRLLMLDEPSLGLAPLVVQQIFQVVRSINQQGVTVLLVEQNVRFALELAHHAYVLNQGRVIKQGTGTTLLQDEEIYQSYLGSGFSD
jgi:branched-chain amino acid transport system ATP-binding protein